MRADKRVYEAAADLARMARGAPPPHRPPQSDFATVEDAIASIGVVESLQDTARKLIEEVIGDTSAVFEVVKAGTEAGIPQPAMRELVERGMRLAWRDRVAKGAAAPEGTRSTHGGIPVIKQGGRWVRDTSAKKDAEPSKLETPEARFVALQKQAAAAGKRVTPREGTEITHDALDKLESALQKESATVTPKSKNESKKPKPEPKPKGKGKGGEVEKSVPLPVIDGRLLVKAGPHKYISRRRGSDGKWIYTYDRKKARDAKAVKQAVAQLKGALMPLNVVADRVWHGVKHTAAEFPTAAKAVGKLMDGEPLTKHDKESLVSVTAMVGSAALAAASYGGAAAGGILTKKFVTHVAMAAMHTHLNTAYTAYAGAGFVGKLIDKLPYLLAKADGPDQEQPTEAEEAQLRKAIEGCMRGMVEILDGIDWTPARMALWEKAGPLKKALTAPPPPPVKKSKRVRATVGRRAPHPKNTHGHRDGLEPGMVLTPRDRHLSKGLVKVLDDGRFEVDAKIVKGGHALLTELYGNADHHQTVRRYFKLGGERATPDLRDPLQSLLKSAGVKVSPEGPQFRLVGDLAKAGVPDRYIDAPRRTTITQAAAVDLIRVLSKEDT